MSGNAQPRMHNLVVCGATDPTRPADAAIFSDFLGFSMLLRDIRPDITGTFLSCFPLDEHFAVLAKRSPPISDIKFGTSGTNGEALYTYSETKHRSRSGLWYTECTPSNLAAKVVSWFHDKAPAVRGDVVNIFLCCHGHREGHLVLGNRSMGTFEFRDILRLFGFGIEANAVVSHCYLGQLSETIESDSFQPRERFIAAACGSSERHYTDRRSISGRFRNMTFSQPIAQFLQTPSQSVRDFNEYLTRFMQNAQNPSTYTYHLTPEKAEATTQISQLLMRDYVDLKYLATSTQRKKVWPTLDLVTRRKMKNVSLACQNRVTSTVDDAVTASLCLEQDPPWHIEDSAVMGRTFEAPETEKDYEWALKSLYFRARRQMNVLLAFRALLDEKFIQTGALEQPLDSDKLDKNTLRANARLYCFDVWQGEFEEDWPERTFDNPVTWLAMLIVRSKCDFESAIQFLITTGVAGSYDLEEYRTLVPIFGSGGEVTDDPDAGVGHGHPMYGFWLPSGIPEAKVNEEMNTCLERLNGVAELALEYFGSS
ncbi:hypothetical protein PHISP_00541 [Aspergillus sp. HF37]|nr:hypothetical protein PHISP_00541 [Aspergillus sp. HF37]